MESRRECLIITYRHHGMWAMAGFALIFFFAMSWAGYHLHNRPPQEDLLLWTTGWAIEQIWSAYMVLEILFSRTVFALGKDELRIIKSLFGFRRTLTVERVAIQRIFQVMYRDEDDNFPSWGLKLNATKSFTLLKPQAYAKSEWLGLMLAKWSGIRFEKLRQPG